MGDIFEGIANVFFRDKIERKRNEEYELHRLEEKLEKKIKKYKKWHKKGVLLSNSLYQLTLLSFREVCKLHDIIEHINVEQRNIIEYKLKGENYNFSNIKKYISALSDITWSASKVPDAGTFAEKTIKTNLAILKEMPDRYGLAAAGLSTIFAGLQYSSDLDNAIYNAKLGQYETLEEIDEIKEKLYILKSYVMRLDELGAGIGKGLKAFKHCYNDFCEKMYPNGEESKRERKQRMKSGGSYFLESENAELENLLKTAGYLLKMIEAKP